jgi:hypothetical protein
MGYNATALVTAVMYDKGRRCIGPRETRTRVASRALDFFSSAVHYRLLLSVALAADINMVNMTRP